MTDDEFLSAFEAVAIPRTDWTHEAHIRMAWLYLTRFPNEEACDRIRTGIQKLNAQNGVVSGFHETITMAFARVISARLLHSESYVAFHARNPDIFDRMPGPLLPYYTRERLLLSDARDRFVEPDVQPLPVISPDS